MSGETRIERFDGDPGRLAVVLPGLGYTAARPLLHYVRAVLLARAWTVKELWWDPPEGDRLEWVGEQAAGALSGEAAERTVLVGKSLGTCAAPLAAERDMPAVWLTPLLGLDAVADAIGRQRAPVLLAGGTGDRTWEGEVAGRSGHEVLEVPGANHGLELPGNPLGSIDALRLVAERVDGFVSALTDSS